MKGSIHYMEAGGGAAGSAPSAAVDAVKAAHRRFPTGVTVVTTCLDGRPYGLAVNAFSSISLSPPLVLVCVAETSATHERLYQGDQIAVNVLAHDQGTLATAFARSGGDKFRGLDWRPGQFGAPLLARVSAYFELEIEKRIPAYTHTIFVARVRAAAAFDLPPLLYFETRLVDGQRLQELA